MLRLTSLCLVLVASIAGDASQTLPARDAAATPPGSGTIRGRVVAAATGRPLHRVRLTLNTQLPNPPSAVTDTRGMFEIERVPAGAYSISAVRSGYLTIQYGQRRPREAGRTIEIRAGETIEGVEIAMFRGGALAGRISDEAGHPAPGVRVEAIEHRYLRGRRVAVAGRIATTNDAGEFRLSGLDPGVYQIRASTSEVWEGDDGKETFVHAVTWYPGVRETDAPQTISVGVGQEVADLEFRLIAGRAARVTGVIEDANGTALAGQQINMDHITRTIGGALMSAGFGGRAKSDESGRFEVPKLAAGEYMVYAGTDVDRAAVQAILRDGELKHVVLTPRKPTVVAGTIVSDDEVRPSFAATRIRIVPIQVDAESVLPVWGAPDDRTTISANWTFRLSNLDGQYLFRLAGLPDGWMLKNVTQGGRDITETPIAVARGTPEVKDLQLVISRKGATVSGEVRNASGAAVPDATVVVFPENRALWGHLSRFVKAVRPDDKGRFAVSALPAGVYRVAARDFVIEGQWEDAEFLELLSRDATRLELAEATEATVTLTVKTQ